MADRIRTKGQTTIYKTLNRKLDRATRTLLKPGVLRKVVQFGGLVIKHQSIIESMFHQTIGIPSMYLISYKCR
jgi:hypothetical protein